MKYGLIWNKKDQKCINKNKINFKHIKELDIIKDSDNHNNVIMDGDNLLSLQLLKEVNKKANLIYIDPPYNTGSQFIYKDGWDHSEWLNFMEPRLELAHDLLTDDGLIFISIDENEYANLKLLMDQIFGEENFITNFIWIEGITPINDIVNNEIVKGKSNSSTEIRKIYENILCYRKTKLGKLGKLKSNNKYIDSRITNYSNAVNTITIKKGTRSDIKELNIKGIHNKGTNQLEYLGDGLIIKNYKVQKDVVVKGRLRNKQILERLNNNKVVFDKNNQRFVEIFINSNGTPQTRKISNGVSPFNIISGFGDSSVGTNNLRRLFNENEVFNFSKPVNLIKYIISLYYKQDNITILDFFAGSGTTGQAVMELNNKDNKNRQFILCSLNELKDGNMVKDITYNRNKFIIEGKTKNNKPIYYIEDKAYFDKKEFEKDYNKIFQENVLLKSIKYKPADLIAHRTFNQQREAIMKPNLKSVKDRELKVKQFYKKIEKEEKNILNKYKNKFNEIKIIDNGESISFIGIILHQKEPIELGIKSNLKYLEVFIDNKDIDKKNKKTKLDNLYNILRTN